MKTKISYECPICHSDMEVVGGSDGISQLRCPICMSAIEFGSWDIQRDVLQLGRLPKRGEIKV